MLPKGGAGKGKKRKKEQKVALEREKRKKNEQKVALEREKRKKKNKRWR